LVRQTSLSFANALPSNNPHGQLYYTAMILIIYLLGASKFWPWISAELSILDTGCALVLNLMVTLAAFQLLPESKISNAHTASTIVILGLWGMLLCRFVFLMCRSLWRNGVSGSFGPESPSHGMVFKNFMQWFEDERRSPKNEIADAVCRMPPFDRQALLDFMTSWNAVTGRSVDGSKWRLKALPTKLVGDVRICEDASCQDSECQTDRGDEHPFTQSSHDLPRVAAVLSDLVEL